MGQGKIFPKPQLHKDLNGNIDKIDFFCMFKPSVRKYLCKLFSTPSVLTPQSWCCWNSNLWQVYKQHGPGEIFILYSDSEIFRAGKRLLEQASPISLPCQCFSLPVAEVQWEQAGKHLALPLVPLQLGLFGLCIATHPTVKAVWVTANCRILYAMLSLKFRVFPPLYQEQVPKGRGWSWLLIQEPNSAPKVTDEPQRLKYKHLVCRYVESLWYISYLTDGKPANISKSLMP